jgi:signal transduction histidine kinase
VADEHQERLDDRVAPLDRDAMTVRIVREQKRGAVGDLAPGIAHELSSPLQYIGDNVRYLEGAFAGLLELVEAYRRLREALQSDGGVRGAHLDDVARAEERADLELVRERLPETFADAADGVSRMRRMVGAMKEFARSPAGRKAPVDLAGAFETVLMIARNEYKYVADLETDFGVLPKVWAHEDELKQVFLNLLVNAARAIGAVVRGTPARGRLRVSTRQEGAFALVAISDTGCGVPEAARRRVFERIFTPNDADETACRGLTVARAIVEERHGGSLTFETELGRGTTFFVRLPLCGCSDADGEAEPE